MNRPSFAEARGAIQRLVFCLVLLLTTAPTGITISLADETTTFAGFRHHFYRGVPNRGLPSYYDARKIGRGEAPYPGAEDGYRR